jgi:hypothetical protein
VRNESFLHYGSFVYGHVETRKRERRVAKLLKEK